MHHLQGCAGGGFYRLAKVIFHTYRKTTETELPQLYGSEQEAERTAVRLLRLA